MGQKDGEKWTAAVDLQPTIPKSDRLLGLFGGWESNWMGYNTAHDLALQNSKHEKLAFFMYPMAENAAGRFDPYAPDDFKFQITAREVNQTPSPPGRGQGLSAAAPVAPERIWTA